MRFLAGVWVRPRVRARIGATCAAAVPIGYLAVASVQGEEFWRGTWCLF